MVKDNGSGEGREATIGTIRLVNVEDEMRGAYLDYAMSVITARALPDVRDGLKPVQRRILYAMNEMGLRHDSPYKKSASTVGDVLGKYHPHGDSAVYDALVRLAQDFTMRYRLIDGQGNFGSVDDDPAAAMRYTEARMTSLAEEMLADIDKNTVDFMPNFDASRQEPTVLPSKVPNLLVNGASGIAVGMATNIPPHNLSEVCDGLIHLIDHPEASVDDLLNFIQGPDFPTAGIILGREGLKSAYSTGHGRVVVQARAHLEEMRGNRYQIVITELPYQVNKAALIEKIADLVKGRREGLDGITEVRDESDRQGLRVVIELRRDCQPKQILNNLYKYTAMRTTFSANLLALVGGQPRVLTLKMALQQYLTFRREVITRRTRFDLEKARERAHILEGLKIALDNLDEVIATIRRSQSAETARTNLMRGFGLSQVQAQAILDMQLRRLAALERKKVLDELAEVRKAITQLEAILADPLKIEGIIKTELRDLKKTYGDDRRTQIADYEVGQFTEDDLIPDQDVVVTISSKGYVKRVTSETYKSQRRGGRGIMGVVTREAETVNHLLVASTRDSLLFFTNRGKVYQARCWDVPDASRQAKGVPLASLISLDPNERVTAVVAARGFEHDYLIMATTNGEIKKTALEEYSSVRSSGLIAMNLEEGDELGWAKLTRAGDQIIVVTVQGQAIRFPEGPLRGASRASGGVRAVRLAPGDRVASVDITRPKGYMLLLTARGFGKRTATAEFPTHQRGGGGIRAMLISDKTGPVVTARAVAGDEEAMIISADGVVIRTPVESISEQGRSTRGVSVMKVDDNDQVAGLALLYVREREQPVLDEISSPAPSGRGATKGKAASGKGTAAAKPEATKAGAATKNEEKAPASPAASEGKAAKPRANKVTRK